MINTFLFDLDGTIVRINFADIEKRYFSDLADYFQEKIDKKLLIQAILESVNYQISDSSDRLNSEKFMERFCQICDCNKEDILNTFIDFYLAHFNKYGEGVKASPVLRKVFDILKQKGYNIVCATNTLLPKVANEMRIRWGGFLPEEFSYITSFDENKYSKPSELYYKEVLDDIGKKPCECIMVGNDMQEDMVAQKVGIKTFLLDGFIIDRKTETFTPDYKGGEEQLLNFVISLPMLK